jgi:hypothetical protein
MKTLGLTKLVTLALILTSFVSCQEEEFYEKEFIDTLNDQYERENLPEEVPTNPSTPPTEPEVPPTEPEVPPTEPEVPPTEPEVPPTEPEVPPVVLEDINAAFTQNSNGGKMDILWVIDNSGSMRGEQQALGENFQAFISEFVQKDVDFKMAITTTDTSGDNAGKEHRDSMTKLTSAELAANPTQFMTDFADLVNVGTRGSGRERGIQASQSFAEQYGSSWMRDDAYLTVVYLSDEEDQSLLDVNEHLTELQKSKANNGLIRAYSIVNMTEYRGRSNFARYKEISDSTNGEVANINSDFYGTLLNMGSSLVNLTEQFPLSETPYDTSSIKVLVDGTEVSTWTYNSVTNSVKFNAGSIPAADAKITITYSKEVI